MSTLPVHSEAQRAPLADRLRSMGLLLVETDAEGRVAAPPPPGGDWLADLFHEAPLFREALRRAVSKWSAQQPAQLVEAVPGLWLAPTPRYDRRRLRGWSVAVIVTDAFHGSEQFVAMCQSAKLDMELARRLLAGLPPVGAREVQRTAAIVRDAVEQEARTAGEHRALESVGQQLAESYEEMNLLYTSIQSMSSVDRPSRFIAIVCQELLATLPYTWVGAQLSDDRDRLKNLAGELIVAGRPGGAPESLRRAARQLLGLVRPDQPLVLDPGHPRYPDFAGLGGSVLVHPVSRDETMLGVLIAGDRKGADRAATNVDIKLLGATATNMAIFLENAALYVDLNAMFMGTLEAITAAIDAKDTYTRGHSQRVAHLTQQLARAIGLDESTVGRMRIAGLVHDVGKIGVPEAVLLKPGRLTDEEFHCIRRHPEIGYRILKDIPQLRDILPGVLYHHERYDGLGYPEGLQGQEIPTVARVIALADAFDAMSSSRTYRPALNRSAVLQEILGNAGSQFDPDIAPVFVKLDFGRYEELFAEHQAGNRTGQGEAA